MQYVSFSKQLIKTAIVSNGVCITIMSQNTKLAVGCERQSRPLARQTWSNMGQAALLFALDAITTGNKSIGYVVCHSSLGVQRLGVS